MGLGCLRLDYLFFGDFAHSNLVCPYDIISYTSCLPFFTPYIITLRLFVSLGIRLYMSSSFTEFPCCSFVDVTDIPRGAVLHLANCSDRPRSFFTLRALRSMFAYVYYVLELLISRSPD